MRRAPSPSLLFASVVLATGCAAPSAGRAHGVVKGEPLEHPIDAEASFMKDDVLAPRLVMSFGGGALRMEGELSRAPEACDTGERAISELSKPWSLEDLWPLSTVRPATGPGGWIAGWGTKPRVREAVTVSTWSFVHNGVAIPHKGGTLRLDAIDDDRIRGTAVVKLDDGSIVTASFDLVREGR